MKRIGCALLLVGAAVAASGWGESPVPGARKVAAQEPPPVPMPPPALPPVVPFKITGETKYKPHRLVKLAAEGLDAKAGLVWWVEPDSVVERATTEQHLMEFAAPPGQYSVKALMIRLDAAGKTTIREARSSVVIESCHPPEPPPPDKGPKPPEKEPDPPVPPKGKGTLNPGMAIGKIQFGNAGCSATVIGPRRPDGRWDVLTAAHCISGVGQSGRIQMPKDGKVHAVKVVNLDKAADLAWLVTDAPIDDIEYANLASGNPAVGTKIWHQGYGYDQPRNREDGEVQNPQNSQNQTQFNLSVSSGDSGGGIFRSDTGEVVSAVCCTSGMARKAAIWGGSCERARAMRPTSSAEGPAGPTEYRHLEFPSEWRPLPIPEREEPK